MAQTMTVPTMTTDQAAEAMGATYRQVDYWSRQGYVRAEVESAGSGSRRRWTHDQVLVGRALAVLTALGAQGSTLAEAAEGLRVVVERDEYRGAVVVDLLGHVGPWVLGPGWLLDLDALARGPMALAA